MIHCICFFLYHCHHVSLQETSEIKVFQVQFFLMPRHWHTSLEFDRLIIYHSLLEQSCLENDHQLATIVLRLR